MNPAAMLPLPATQDSAQTIAAAVARLNARFGAAPDVAVVLGSGWSAAAQRMQGVQRLAYTELPGFMATQVEGHAGEVVLGRCGDRNVAMLCGRTHTYESGDCAAMAPAVRSLQAWGVKVLVLTNAAGSLRTHMPAGSLMLIADHINAPQRSPLVGVAGSDRFVDMGAAYDASLRAHALQVAHERQQPLAEGTYLWALGPQFETPAEIRMFAAWGADAVGMSTVPETILARHCGLRVLGLSLITNMAAGMSDAVLSHAATLEQAQASSDSAAGFLIQLLATLPLAAPSTL